MFNFTPLLGAQSNSSASQSLLEFDGGLKILLDVGWDERFDVECLKPLEDQVSSISLILLTHATLDHIGAFAHFCKHVPGFRQIPVYATGPVISLGRTLLQDLYASTPCAATTIPASFLAENAAASLSASDQGLSSTSILLDAPTKEEISSFCSLINSLRFSQPLTQPLVSQSSPPSYGLTITAYSAGHTLGGTMWHIQHGLESIVYAVDWNLAKENTLSGAAWLAGGAEILEPLRRPTALVCSSKSIDRLCFQGGRRKRDERLVQLIESTVSQGGMVLIPSDSSARILELAYLVEQLWRRMVVANKSETFRNARAFMASRTAGSTIHSTRSMVEWMDDDLIRELDIANDAQRARSGAADDKQDQTPFDFKHVKLIERKTQLKRALSAGRPGVIIASDTSMEWGFSAEALQALCADPRNLVILTETQQSRLLSDGRQCGVACTLYDIWKTAVSSGETTNTQIIHKEARINTSRPETRKLDDREMSEYQQYLARQRQIQSIQQGESAGADTTALDAAAEEPESDSSESSDGSDDENVRQGKALNLSAAMSQSKRKVGLTDAELGVNILIRRKDVYDYDVRNRKGREKIFPYVVKKHRDDIYGDVIRPEDYLRAEEKDADAEDVLQKDTNTTAVGQKRRWAEANKRESQNNQRKIHNDRTRKNANTASTDVQPVDQEPQEASEAEESDYEPDEATTNGPQKVVFTEVPLTIRMGICYIDFSGLHERRDLQMLLPLIKPRKMIITCGTQAETQTLANDCQDLLGEAKEAETRLIFTPRVNETIDASVDTSAWTVKLTRDLVKKLKWQHVRGLSIVAVTARLGTRAVTQLTTEQLLQQQQQQQQQQQGRRKKLKILEDGSAHDDTEDHDSENAQTVVSEPVLDVIVGSRGNNSVTSNGKSSDGAMPMTMMMMHVTQPIHVGDLRLADLRRLMQASGHVAEFKGEGTLLVDGTVIVRKTAGGRINVEGGAYMGAGDAARYDPGGSFFAVRRKIYEGLAVVAGG